MSQEQATVVFQAGGRMRQAVVPRRIKFGSNSPYFLSRSVVGLSCVCGVALLFITAWNFTDHSGDRSIDEIDHPGLAARVGEPWRPVGVGTAGSLSAKVSRPEVLPSKALPVAAVSNVSSAFLLAEPGVSHLMPDDLPENLMRGRQLYNETCADCHGPAGEGVPGAYDAALVGDDSLAQLTEVISATMPEGEPEVCQGDDAAAVAAYVHYAFYSEAAQVRNRPPRISFSRLTASQLRQSYADLYASMANGTMWSKPDRGVQGIYFNTDHWKDEERKLQRIDPVIDFDFGRDSPVEGVAANKFYIHWNGGLKVDHTGDYELVVHCTSSFMLYFGRDGRVFFDNHVQSGDQAEFRQTIHLTAGRVYPFKLEMRQRERKTETPPAMVRLSWVTPGGVEQVVPSAHLIPGWTPPAYSLQTPLPPDDMTYGYERGLLVNPEWDQATTAAAIEFAEVAIEELWPTFMREYIKENKESNERTALREFLRRLVATAFRFELSSEQVQRYIESPVEANQDNAMAIKQVLLFALKTPYFLYPATSEFYATPSRQAANRLALTLFDSLPSDEALLKLAGKEEISEDEIREYVWTKWNDFRVQAKYRELLYQWLHLQRSKDISKSQELYPGFSPELIEDLRASFDLMLSQVLNDSNGSLMDLLQTRQVFTSSVLHAYYGESWATDPSQASNGKFSNSVPNEQRRGVLTHPFFTSTFSYHNATSPIHRGVVLYRYLLGRMLRPPTDDFAPLSPDLHPDLTTRERVTLQTSPEACQVCHQKINPLGFTLEQFDATGRWRVEEDGDPVDASGAYIERSGETHTFANAAELADYLIESRDMRQAFVNRAFQHFTKQPISAYGTSTLDELTDHFESSGLNLTQLMVEIAVISSRSPSIQR